MNLESRQSRRFSPPAPTNLAETGLPASLIEQLILKIIYFRGEIAGGDLSRAIGLKFNLLEEIVDWYKRQHILEVKRSLGYGPVSEMLALTESGRKIARDYLEINQYTGAAPVPISQYTEAVKAQRLAPNWLTPERLAKAYTHMVVEENVLEQLGPAVNSGKSFLIYGQPGNGKTYLAEALFNIRSSDVYVPYALECQGNIIHLYDPLFHQRVEREGDGEELFLDSPCDDRWALCRRPFIVTGGELCTPMLDLSFNAVSKVYDAPYQLKANNGTYLIDDFGRQKASPAEILNRWIVPMERRVDYLSFLNGGKMSVPFETFLIFSTNVTPDKIGDEAFLRRIQYKMLLRSPDQQEFRTIFLRYCESRNLTPDLEILDAFISKHYTVPGRPFRRCHPRDVISQAVDFLNFKGLSYELTEQVLDRAFASCFLPPREIEEDNQGPRSSRVEMDSASAARSLAQLSSAVDSIRGGRPECQERASRSLCGGIDGQELDTNS